MLDWGQLGVPTSLECSVNTVNEKRDPQASGAPDFSWAPVTGGHRPLPESPQTPLASGQRDKKSEEQVTYGNLS